MSAVSVPTPAHSLVSTTSANKETKVVMFMEYVPPIRADVGDWSLVDIRADYQALYGHVYRDLRHEAIDEKTPMPKRNWLSVRAEHQPVLKTTGLHMTHLGGGALQLKSSRSWPAKLLGVSSCFSVRAVRFTSSNVPSGKKITASQVGVLASWFIFCLGCTALEMNKRRCINAVHSTVRTSF